MKLTMKALLSLALATKVHAVDDHFYVHHQAARSGVFHECSPADDQSWPRPVLYGLCGSGKNADCYMSWDSAHKFYEGFLCELFPLGIPTTHAAEADSLVTHLRGAAENHEESPSHKKSLTLAGSSSHNESPGPDESSSVDEQLEVQNDGWICGAYGQKLYCPSGQAIIGVCGSGENPDCKDHCSPDGYHAIKCARGPDVLRYVGQGQWRQLNHYGVWDECKPNEVACGACQSGREADCTWEQSRGWTQLRCCPVLRYGVTGKWVYLATHTDTRTFSITVGYTESATDEQSSTFMDSVTASAEIGVSVEGLGSLTSTLSATQSQTYTSHYQSTWTMTRSESRSIEINQDKEGMAMYQWFNSIVDENGHESLVGSDDIAWTISRRYPPKCVPGFSLGTSTDYQACYADYYLPGFGSEAVLSDTK